MTNAFNLSQLANNTNSSGQVAAGTGISGTLGVANGGTGATTLTSANVILGAGTSAVTFVAPGTTGNVLKSNGTTWTSSALTGSVLQVVSATYSTSTSNATTTLQNTNLTASITPRSTSSKILVIVSQNGCYNDANNSGMRLALLRDSTVLINAGYYLYYLSTVIGSISTNYLDSPSTTSSVAYKTQFCRSPTNTGTPLVQHESSVSTITLMEIAG